VRCGEQRTQGVIQGVDQGVDGRDGAWGEVHGVDCAAQCQMGDWVQSRRSRKAALA
jgi:hypothetical protein